MKNEKNRMVVLNAVARSVIETYRGLHPIHVFTLRGRPIETMHNNGWQTIRKRVANRYQETFKEPAAYSAEDDR